MTPINFSAITPGSVGASPASGASTIFRPNAADFTSKLSANDGQISTQITGGAQSAGQAASSQAISEPTNWGHLAQQMVRDVNAKQDVAAHKISDVLAGGPTPVHEALIASEEASVSFQVIAEIRNKVIEAYQEVMRMQV